MTSYLNILRFSVTILRRCDGENKLYMLKSILVSCLIQLLGIWIHVSGTSSLTTLNVPGIDNDITNISSRSFKRAEYFTAS